MTQLLTNGRTLGAEATGDLRLLALTKRFGATTAVDELELAIPSGSFFALIGPSGCGKTTTLRMIAGLEEPTSGSIRLGENDLTRVKPYRRPVNTVFQNYALFPHLDVFENVAFGLRRRGEGQIERRVAEVLELVELPQLARRRPAQLSGGQQQRIALARAIVNRPSVLLLDEPLGALDLKLRRQMQLELKRIQTEVGITFVHVTHDQEEAMTMADTVAVMNAGRLEQLGRPEDLYESPRTTFVANFLGQSNLVAGQRRGSEGERVVVECFGQRLTLPSERVATPQGRFLVGVRPEKVRLIGRGESAVGQNLLVGGTVTDISFCGVSTQYLVRMPWGQQFAVFAQNLGAGVRFGVGSSVGLVWDPRHTFGLAGDARAGIELDGAELSAEAS